MSIEPDEKTKIVYRHHPLDIVVIAIAFAVIVLLVSRTDWFTAAPEYSTLAAGLGAAALVTLFSALFVWGTRNEHRLDAELDMAIHHADDNLRRIDTLQERLAKEPQRKARPDAAQQ